VLGVPIFLWATGLAVIRTGALPKWLGYVMILLGVVALTPIGWAAAIGTAILVLVLSILLPARAYSRTSERIDRVTA
jgi:membrane protein implicated in regulation of membrane protease activity